MAEDLGKTLENLGWRQGSYFTPLSHLIHFNIDQPLTVKGQPLIEAREAYDKERAKNADAVPVAQAALLGKAKEGWILITQDCDLAKAESAEPYVTAIRCFPTENDVILKQASTNSSSFFLINDDLVADSRRQIQLEKPALLAFHSREVFPSRERLGRFVRWLTRRIDRPATPDHVVEAFVQPTLDLLRRLRDSNPAALECLEVVREIRFHVTDETPMMIELLFFVDPLDIPPVQSALAVLVALIVAELDPSVARLAGWDARNLTDISVADYLATDQMYLDYYTYRGETVAGLPPPPRI